MSPIGDIGNKSCYISSEESSSSVDVRQLFRYSQSPAAEIIDNCPVSCAHCAARSAKLEVN
jgi:hypothetical protein